MCTIPEKCFPCNNCKNYIEDREGKEYTEFPNKLLINLDNNLTNKICKAFPEGIPYQVYGENCIRFGYGKKFSFQPNDDWEEKIKEWSLEKLDEIERERLERENFIKKYKEENQGKEPPVSLFSNFKYIEPLFFEWLKEVSKDVPSKKAYNY